MSYYLRQNKVFMKSHFFPHTKAQYVKTTLVLLMSLSLLTADILQANDSLTQVINMYRHLVKGEDVPKDGTTMPSQPGGCMHVIWHPLLFLLLGC